MIISSSYSGKVKDMSGSKLKNFFSEKRIIPALFLMGSFYGPNIYV